MVVTKTAINRVMNILALIWAVVNTQYLPDSRSDPAYSPGHGSIGFTGDCRVLSRIISGFPVESAHPSDPA
jgi:hypothetical protein